jgi:hypothetical protein
MHSVHTTAYCIKQQVVCGSINDVISCTAGAPASLIKAALIACGFVHIKSVHSNTLPQHDAALHSTANTADADTVVIEDSLTLQQQLELRGGGLTIVSSSLLPTGRSVTHSHALQSKHTCYTFRAPCLNTYHNVVT